MRAFRFLLVARHHIYFDRIFVWEMDKVTWGQFLLRLTCRLEWVLKEMPGKRNCLKYAETKDLIEFLGNANPLLPHPFNLELENPET